MRHVRSTHPRSRLARWRAVPAQPRPRTRRPGSLAPATLPPRPPSVLNARAIAFSGHLLRNSEENPSSFPLRIQNARSRPLENHAKVATWTNASTVQGDGFVCLGISKQMARNAEQSCKLWPKGLASRASFVVEVGDVPRIPRIGCECDTRAASRASAQTNGRRARRKAAPG